MKTQYLFSQNWSEVTSGERNEIVFEGLNQLYGAYEIRVNYDRTLLKAFSGTALLILVLSTYLLLSSLLKKTIETKTPVTNSTLIVLPPKANDPEIPKTIDPPKTQSAPLSQLNLQPVVTTEPVNVDPIIPENTRTTSSLTGTPTDTTGNDPGFIPETNGGGHLLPPETEIFTIGDLEEIPRFPGGEGELSQFLKNNLHIPEELTEIGGIKEKVGIAFIIDKDGSIMNAMILQNGSKFIQLNNEAMRVIKKMPKWEPGRQNGNPVKVQMVLPIRFEVK